ncbi:hypothetical protein RvY_07373 [Ramazzottius varieornatus]|uniref:DDE-1 domain-containing protein n=1 Tax=Ramazzottius varieornatus TaxID=947166 RepID=A0A1D1V1W7_RAMVA|nr:hypothetical protein RvY_07373 [Ramazzottius varieornatus]
MTINLTIKADGTKFPAEIIFKMAAKSGKLADSYLKKLNAPSNVVIFSAKKAWWNQEIVIDYHNMHFPAPVEKDQMTVLFRDQFSIHEMDENVDSLEWRNVQQILIPPGMTGQWQPVDVSVNKPFKDYFKEEYRNWRKNNINFSKSGYIQKPNRRHFVQFISDAWEKITPEVVQGSFYAALILRRDEFLPKEPSEDIAGSTVDLDADEEENILDISIYNESSFLDSGHEDEGNDEASANDSGCEMSEE